MYKTPNGTKAVDIRGETKTENGIEYRRVQILPAFPQRFEWIRKDNLIPISDAAAADVVSKALGSAHTSSLKTEIAALEVLYAEAKRLHRKRGDIRKQLDDLNAQVRAANAGYLLA